MLEKNLQQKVLQICKQRDILALKLDSSSSRGWPDLVVIMPTGEQFYVELKTKTGKLSKLQEHMHKQITKNKGLVYVIRSIEEFTKLIT